MAIRREGKSDPEAQRYQQPGVLYRRTINQNMASSQLTRVINLQTTNKMSEQKMPRLLEASEIEIRVKTWDKAGHKWAMMLLYKDARCDMRILDEMYGVDGWQREHQEIGGRLYCTISIWSERTNQWVKKQDVGVESETEKEKGQASDSFKRAGFNFGIGRELYTGPRIFIKTTEKDYKNGNFATPLEVTKIEYNKKREITALKIADDKGAKRFSWTAKKGTQETSKAPVESKDDDDLALAIDDIRRAQSLTELNDVAKRWSCFMGNPKFMEAGTKRRTELMQE